MKATAEHRPAYQRMPAPLLVEIEPRRRGVGKPIGKMRGCIVLSREEMWLLDCMVRGLTRKETARIMGYENFRRCDVVSRAIRVRVGARSSYELIAMAVRSGWVE
jgi:DNA-binding CsgD family transcriptional regulator